MRATRSGSPRSRWPRWRPPTPRALAAAIRGAPLPGRRAAPAAGGDRRLPAVRRRGRARRPTAPVGVRCRPATSRRSLRAAGSTQASPTAREVAGLAAAVGRDFTLDLLVEASDLDADSVVRAVDELWRRRIVRERGDGYDFSHDLLRDAGVRRRSARRGGGCCTAGSPRALELLHADDTDPVSAQLAEQYARGGRPERAVRLLPPRRRASRPASSPTPRRSGCTPRRWPSCGRSPARARPRPAGAALPGGDGGAAQRALRLLLPAAAGGARARRSRWPSPSGRGDSLLNGLVGLWASRFVQGASPTRTGPRPGPSRSSTPGSELGGAAHFAVRRARQSASGCRPRRCGTSSSAARLPRRDASLSVGTRPDVHALAWSAHAHWLLGDDDQALSELPGRRRRRPGSIDHPYSLAVALAYAAITHQLRGDRAGAARARSPSCRELCDRYGFAYYREWALVLDGWRSGGAPGIDADPSGASTTSTGGLVRPDAVLAVAAGRRAGPRRPARSAARSTLDAATAERAGPRATCGGCRRCCACGPPTTARAGGVARLAHGRRPGARHGSVALLRRCQRRPGRARRSRAGDRPFARRPDGDAGARTLRERPVPSVGPQLHRSTRRSTTMTHHTADAVVHRAVRRARRRPARRPDHAGRPALRRGARRLQRHDRQAPGGDRPLPRRRRRRRLRPLRPRARPRPSPSAAAATTPPASASWTTRSSSTCRRCAAPPSTRASGTVRVDGGCTWGDVDHATVGFGMATPSGLPRLHRRRRADPRRRASATCPAASGSPSTTCSPPTSSSPTAASSRPARPRTPTCSGRCAAAAATSASSRRSPSAATTSASTARSSAARCSTTSPTPPRCMRWYRELLPSLPEELSGWFGLITIPPAPPFPEELWGRKACAIVWCYTGPHDRADEVLEPVKQLRLAAGRRSAADAVHRAAERLRRAVPGRLQWYWRADLFTEISDDGDRRPRASSAPSCPAATRRCTSTRSTARRAACRRTRRPSPTATAAGPASSSASTPTRPTPGAISQWARDYWDALHPTSAGGAYVNFLMDEGEDRVRAAYRGNYDRLAQVKRTYDPREPLPRQPEHPAGAPPGVSAMSARPTPRRNHRVSPAPVHGQVPRRRPHSRQADERRAPPAGRRAASDAPTVPGRARVVAGGPRTARRCAPSCGTCRRRPRTAVSSPPPTRRTSSTSA